MLRIQGVELEALFKKSKIINMSVLSALTNPDALHSRSEILTKPCPVPQELSAVIVAIVHASASLLQAEARLFNEDVDKTCRQAQVSGSMCPRLTASEQHKKWKRHLNISCKNIVI